MEIPVQVTFRGTPVSDAIEATCLEHARKLDRFFDRVTSCRVVVAIPHRQHTKGQLYSIGIDLTVPGGEIVVNRDQHDEHAHEDVSVAIRDAFNRARRQLEDHVQRLRSHNL